MSEPSAAAPTSGEETKPKARQYQEAYKITHQSVKEMAAYLLRGWPECCGTMSIESWIVSFTDDLPRAPKPQSSPAETTEKCPNPHCRNGKIWWNSRGGSEQEDCPICHGTGHKEETK
jgi:hypothetical protein